MNTNRRSLLSAAGSVGLLSLFGSKPGLAGSGEAVHKGKDGSKGVMELCKVKAEPFVRCCYPTHARFGDGLGSISSQVVVITAEGLERIDWDVGREKTCWLLRLPEQLFIKGQRCHYQIGMDWQLRDGVWCYENCPVRNLRGCWKYADGKLELDAASARQRPILGTLAGSIHADSRGAHYTLTARNTSDEVWRGVFFWFCLNHYQSRITGYRPHFRVGSSWLPAQEMRSATVHTYYPAPGMVEEYAATDLNDLFQASHTELSFPGVVCWNHTAKGPLLVCHYSKDAVAVGSNQNWPCTDTHLWFGDIAPGEQKSKTGHVLIAKADLKTFAEQADLIAGKDSYLRKAGSL